MSTAERLAGGLPQWGTAPIRCGRTRCKWRGFETDLNKKPERSTVGGFDWTISTCPACGNSSYSFMTEREIAAWERAKAKQEVKKP